MFFGIFLANFTYQLRELLSAPKDRPAPLRMKALFYRNGHVTSLKAHELESLRLIRDFIFSRRFDP
tara:strand:- start:2 stop:199 length:198 start_codon:yes stop_codon:yes gene_type:complete